MQRQIEYGRQRGVPWGISESGYNATDAALNYQYRAFGVPGLGLKRGLADDLVVAPYASMMALMVAPEPACENLQRLAAAGAAGTLRPVRGDRLHAGAPAARPEAAPWCARSWRTTRAWACWRWRTCCRTGRCSGASPPIRRMQATLLLLQERVPRVVAFQPEHRAERAGTRGADGRASRAPTRVIRSADTPRPRCSCCPTAATT